MDQGTFDDRYGAGAHARLLALLDKPCATFAEIAAQYGVTRERVRQWHRDLRPDAPTGRARRRACAVYQQRKRLMMDPVFRAFVRHARLRLGPGVVEPIRTRHGYRARVVLVAGARVALREARGEPAASPRLPRYRGLADFLYVLLPDDDFLVVPCGASTTAHVARNSFDPLTDAGTAASRSSASASAPAACEG